MHKLLLVLIPGLLAVLAARCSNEEEVIRSTAPASGSATATATISVSGTATSATAFSQTPPPTVPQDWATYSDQTLGFTLQYPAELAVTEKGPSDPAQGERDVEFRTQGSSPVLTMVVAILANPRDLMLDEWVSQYAACVAGSVSAGTVAGDQAIFCNSQPVDVLEPAVAFEHGNDIFLIRSTMGAQQFDFVTRSLQLSTQ